MVEIGILDAVIPHVLYKLGSDAEEFRGLPDEIELRGGLCAERRLGAVDPPHVSHASTPPSGQSRCMNLTHLSHECQPTGSRFC